MLKKKFVRENKGRIIVTVETDATAMREMIDLYADILTIIVPAVMEGDFDKLSELRLSKED